MTTKLDRSNIDRYFFMNTLGISGTEFFWGLGLPVVVESTFLQIFLRQLGASRSLIGMVPAFLFTGLSLFGLLSGYFTSHLRSKKRAVIATHLAGSFPFMIFGGVLYFSGFRTFTIPLFFLAYGCFSSFLGLMAPLWQNYIIKIFSKRMAVRGLSFMWIFQSGTKIIASFLIARIIERYGMTPSSAASLFFGTGLVFFVGSFMFFLTNEGEENGEERIKKVNFVNHLVRTAREGLKNRNFLLYLLSDIETSAVLAAVSFYAIYATEYCSIPSPVAAGIFVALYYAGGFTANIILGSLDLLRIKTKLYLSKFLALTAIILLVLFSAEWLFLVVSFLLGFSRANRNMIYPVALKQIVAVEDATNYFAFAYILLLPFTVGLPIVSGRFLDIMGAYGVVSYRILFVLIGFLILVSFLFLKKAVFPADLSSGKTG